MDQERICDCDEITYRFSLPGKFELFDDGDIRLISKVAKNILIAITIL